MSGTATVLPDIPAMLATLVRHEMDFVVIGGVAVAYHGFVRATRDVDIIPRPERDNLARLWRALEELEARPAAARNFRPDELPVPFTLDGLLDLGSWDLETKHGRLEILQHLAGKLEEPQDYDRLRAAAEGGDYDFG
ncbi:MAG: hypothetical protein M3168_01220, partial [Actinomycetota bacterium]|nr:hypothetical protein [Actinomycetota bacterium]